MKNKIPGFLVIFLLCSSFAIHKFYTAIYQIEFESEKKEVQVTMRLFVDDINEAIEKKYHKKTFVGSKNESSQDLEWLKKYLSENFKISVNGKVKPLLFHQKEIENNLLICYLKVVSIPKVQNIQIDNTILIDLHAEQQNIMQVKFNGKKQSQLFTDETTKGIFK